MLYNGIRIRNPGTDGNMILGNYIGTDITGTVDLGNNDHGVHVRLNAANNTIGGTASGARNLISGNNEEGVRLIDSGTTGNTVQGNYIGTNISGTANLGNTKNGVGIWDGASINAIGGTTPGAANRIAFSGLGGVVVLGNATTDNAIRGNSHFENAILGIDLSGPGLTPNDPGDGDTGPNNIQNFPDVTAANVAGGSLLVTYSVDSNPPNATYPLAIDFFKADAADEEGQTFLISDSYTETDHGGCGTPPCMKAANLGSVAALEVSPGQKLVATATDDAGNTSEFSLFITVSSASGARYVATTGSDAGNDCMNPANPCATVGRAVDQAAVGDIINVAAGTYTEPGLIIDKAVIVQGAGVIVQ